MSLLLARFNSGRRIYRIYCEAYATIYDQSLKQGKSEQYARRYAYMYSEWIGNHYGKELSDAYEGW